MRVAEIPELYGAKVSATVRQDLSRRMSGVFARKLEAPPGFEPGVEVLQTSALPLGDGALMGEWLTRKSLSDRNFCGLRFSRTTCQR